MNFKKKLKTFKPYLLLLFAILFLAIYIFPVYWVVITSFKTIKETTSWPPVFIPKDIDLKNYIAVLESDALMHLKNSLIISLPVTIITIITSLLSAYSLSRFKNKWVNFLILFFLITQMLPQILMVTPLFMIFNKLNLLNTYWSVILGKTAVAIPLAVVFLTTTFNSIPISLEEAAWIDGCSRFKSFLKIAVPIAKPGIFVITAITFMFAWGDFIYSISFLNDISKQPATVGLYTFIGAQVTQWNKAMAFTNFIVLPILAIFLLLQNKIISGWTSGAFK